MTCLTVTGYGGSPSGSTVRSTSIIGWKLTIAVALPNGHDRRGGVHAGGRGVGGGRLLGHHLLGVRHARLRILELGAHVPVLVDLVALLLEVADALEEAHGQLAWYAALKRCATAGLAFTRTFQPSSACCQFSADTPFEAAISTAFDWSYP